MLTSLAPVTTYFYQVTSADAAGNTAASPILSFTMPATQFAATDTTVADFGAGTSDGQVYVAQTADGEVILSPAAGSEFSGHDAAGGLVVDGLEPGRNGHGLRRHARRRRRARGNDREFRRQDDRSNSWRLSAAARFSTSASRTRSTRRRGPSSARSTAAALFARTNSGGASIDTPLAGSLIGSPHRFRIDWTPTTVVYSVDGSVVATHAIAIAGPLRPLASDFTVGSGSVSVDWIRMSPYAAAGTFVSRVFDATQAVDWGGLSWTTETPAGTSVAFFARHGDTPLPDASWSAFAPVAQPGDRHRRPLALRAVPRRSREHRSSRNAGDR